MHSGVYNLYGYVCRIIDVECIGFEKIGGFSLRVVDLKKRHCHKHGAGRVG